MSEERQELDADDPSAAHNVAYMDQALWRALLNQDQHQQNSFADTWLAIQCRKLKSVQSGALFEVNGEDLVVTAAWQVDDARLDRLRVAATSSINEGKPIMRAARASNDAGTENCAIAVPIPARIAGLPNYAIAVVQALKPDIDPRNSIRELEWGAAWIRDRVQELHSAQLAAKEDRSARALNVAASCLSQRGFDQAAQALAVSVARDLQCDRVSVGIRKDQTTTLRAISNNADFSGRMALVRQLEAVMDEAIDQSIVIRTPAQLADNDFTLRYAHEAFTANGGTPNVMTVPIFDNHAPIGAITLERQDDHRFSEDEAELVDTICSLTSLFLVQTIDSEKWLVRRLADDGKTFLKGLFGPKHYARKAITSAIGLFLLAGFTITPKYAFDASASIEGRIKRVITSPIDGYIGEATRRAGDVVEEGDVLARLDDRELRLQLESWRTVKRQRQREFDRALAEADPPAIQILRAQLSQADAQIGALNAQLERTQLVAPFDGLVVAGDLGQSIGGAVQRGEVLFEFTPLDGFRVILSVDERDLDDVSVGQTGRLLLATYPDQPIDFEIIRVTPVAEVEDGKNVFRAEAALSDTSLPLRPGMEGVAKVNAGRRRLFYIWTNELNETIRLALWRFWG